MEDIILRLIIGLQWFVQFTVGLMCALSLVYYGIKVTDTYTYKSSNCLYVIIAVILVTNNIIVTVKGYYTVDILFLTPLYLLSMLPLVSYVRATASSLLVPPKQGITILKALNADEVVYAITVCSVGALLLASM